MLVAQLPRAAHSVRAETGGAGAGAGGGGGRSSSSSSSRYSGQDPRPHRDSRRSTRGTCTDVRTVRHAR